MEIDMKDYDFPTIWAIAQRALNRVNGFHYNRETANYGYGPHRWWTHLSNDFALHPVVQHIVYRECVRPIDWQLLLLEWPHVSTEDDSQIAYTRNERAGEDYLHNGSARQTRTSIGKYLSRHWPHVPDHVRRDWAGRHNASKFVIWDTKEGIISSVELGPRSCMKSSYGSIPFRDADNNTLLAYHAGEVDARTVKWHYHPYFVYNPERGWASAVRIDSGKPTVVLGRALIHTKHKCFVRSYMRGETESSTSYTDERLEAWLREQGYERRSQWPYGVTFDRVNHPYEGLMMPYIDGGVRRVSDAGDHMVLDGDGPECDNTNGVYEAREVYGACEDCGATVYDDDDDRIWVGNGGERLIGGECGCCNNYRHVEGDCSSYYVHEDDAIRVRGEWYDSNNLPDCIKELDDGDYEHEDYCKYIENQDKYVRNSEAVYCETDGEYYEDGDDEIVEIDSTWYRKDDDDNVVECEDGEYRMKEDCWQCEYSNEWYSNDEDGVDVSEGKYHPDSLREMADSA